MKAHKVTHPFLSILFVLFILGGISSCSKDDPAVINNNNTNEPTIDYYFTYKGVKHELAYGVAEWKRDFSQQDYYIYRVVIAADMVTYNADAKKFEGSGECIEIILNRDSKTDLSGTYPYDPQAGANLKLHGGNLRMSGEFWSGDGLKYYITGGEVSFSKSGDVYTVNFNLLCGNDAVTGTFVGPIAHYNGTSW